MCFFSTIMTVSDFKPRISPSVMLVTHNQLNWYKDLVKQIWPMNFNLGPAFLHIFFHTFLAPSRTEDHSMHKNLFQIWLKLRALVGLVDESHYKSITSFSTVCHLPITGISSGALNQLWPAILHDITTNYRTRSESKPWHVTNSLVPNLT